LGASSSGFDPSYGFTVGSFGIKVTGDSWFDGNLNMTGNISSVGNICLDDGCKSNWSDVTGTSYWTASGNNIYNNNSANVGIGTASPDNKLEVVTNENIVAEFSTSENNWASIDIRAGNTASYDAAVRFFDRSTDLRWSIGKSSSNNFYIYRAGGGLPLLFPFLIDSSGNVGIGVTDPGYKLDIKGTIRARDFTSAGGKNIIVGDDIYLTDIDTANMLGVYGMQNSDRAGIRLGSDGSYIFGDNGNVGIGTASPGYKLTVNGPIGTPNMNHPYLVLDSNSSGSNTNEQSAQISLGESGRGSASLHLAYTGDGYSYIGMGDLGSDNIPDHWALRFYYQNDDTYAHNNINANDFYIRAIGKWASTLGGVDLQGWSFQNDKLLDDGENVIQTSDEWLRLNQDSNFSSGIYTPGKLQADGGLYVSDDERIYRYAEDYVATDDNFMVTGSGWLRVDGNEGIYFQSYGGGWHMTDSTYIRNYGSKRVYLNNYLYAPRMYDQNDTGYYLDPNSTSRLYRIDANYFYYASDRSLKTAIKPISDSLEKVLQLQGVSFDWKDTGKPSIGLISQDVEKIFPEIISTDNQGLKSIEYAKLVAPLIEAVKEQQKEIEALRIEIEDLKK
jgi:hypothetical protein